MRATPTTRQAPSGAAGGVLLRLRARRDRDESGLSLIELMMAMLIFSLAATAIASGFIAAIKTSGNDRNRLAATNLAQRELEIARNVFAESDTGYDDLLGAGTVVNPNPLPGGTAGQPLRVDGRPYTVTRRVQTIDGARGQSLCDGGTGVLYPALAVNVTVTWPSLGNAKPVESNTILTPPKTQISSTSAYVAVKLTGISNLRTAGVPVRVTRKSTGALINTVVTASDGCAAFKIDNFPGPNPNYVVSVDEPGYVDNNGQQALSKDITVTAATFQLVPLSYARAATLAVTFKSSDDTYSVPTGVGSVGLFNTTLPPVGEKVVTGLTNPGPSDVGGLWPDTTGYSVWSGSCTQSDPVNAGGAREPAVVAGPGATAQATAWLRPAAITVRKGAVVQPGVTVVAYPLSTDACLAAENPLTLGVTAADGTLKSSLPGGNWRIQVTGRSPSGSWPTTGALDPAPTSTAVTVNVAVT